MRLTRPALAFFAAGILLTSYPAFAWGPDGHHEVGAIADQLIAGTNTERQVKAILGGGLTLEEAAVWADCAKGVAPNQNYNYTTEGKYPECAIFETPDGEAAMSDFVKRNDTNCNPKPDEESCHKQYHYADIAIQRGKYGESFTGARADDVVHAVVAAIDVLEGKPAPAPFNLKDKKEALLLLTHYIGDLHQPLHVGAVYLDAKGQKVDPDKNGYDPKTDTKGGNKLSLGGRANLHSKWDAIPAKLTVPRMTPAILAKAKAVSKTSGKVEDWPKAWASQTVVAAKGAFTGVTFGPRTKAA